MGLSLISSTSARTFCVDPTSMIGFSGTTRICLGNTCMNTSPLPAAAAPCTVKVAKASGVIVPSAATVAAEDGLTDHVIAPGFRAFPLSSYSAAETLTDSPQIKAGLEAETKKVEAADTGKTETNIVATHHNASVANRF